MTTETLPQPEVVVSIFPIVGEGIFGLALAVLFANLTIASYREAQHLPSEPIHLTTAEAVALASEGYQVQNTPSCDGVFCDLLART